MYCAFIGTGGGVLLLAVCIHTWMLERENDLNLEKYDLLNRMSFFPAEGFNGSRERKFY